MVKTQWVEVVFVYVKFVFQKTPSKELQVMKGNRKMIFESQEFYIPLIPGYPFSVAKPYALLKHDVTTSSQGFLSSMTCRQDTATEGPGRPLTRSGSILHDPQKFPYSRWNVNKHYENLLNIGKHVN